jgi:hypothetical protein
MHGKVKIKSVLRNLFFSKMRLAGCMYRPSRQDRERKCCLLCFYVYILLLYIILSIPGEDEAKETLVHWKMAMADRHQEWKVVIPHQIYAKFTY